VKIVVRRMAASDLDRVMGIALGEKNAPQWTRAMYMAALDPRSVPKRVALVAVALEAVAGFAVARLTASEAELETIVTASAFQRRGVARRVFGDLCLELGQFGVHEIFLEVRESNRPAKGLYQALGFLEIARRRGYYTDPIEDALQMRLLRL